MNFIHNTYINSTQNNVNKKTLNLVRVIGPCNKDCQSRFNRRNVSLLALLLAENTKS